MSAARNPHEIAYQQAMIYAAELRELYHKSRATAEEIKSRQEISGRIDRVLAEDGLTTVFQPIVDLRSGKPSGMEALSRFTIEPARTPDVWFAEAEATGRLTELDLKAAQKALDHLASIPPRSYVAVNMSPQTVLTEGFQRLLDHVSPSRVVLEITEHAAVDDYASLASALRDFRSHGGRLAVDDAGAGFASLRHILALEPNIIKLDISLTNGVDIDPSRRALAKALISFAQDIGVSIVAEGIETQNEMKTLRMLGVSYGQGFYLARPAPLTKLRLERRARRRD
jgi:EAL domain-containing protein (putative c-di-GMP-specific phosphodiesterase class I)